MSELRSAKRVRLLAVMASCAVLSVFVAGCQQKVGEGPSEAQVNLQKLLKLRSKYMAAHQGKDPTSDEDFKKFAKGLKEADLKDLDITNVDAVFISPRDNQPYVINYGAMSGREMPRGAKMPTPAEKEKMTKSGGKPPVFAYEKTGVGGKRFVAMAMGASIIEVSDEAFEAQYKP